MKQEHPNRGPCEKLEPKRSCAWTADDQGGVMSGLVRIESSI